MEHEVKTELPEGSLVKATLLIVTYFDSDGNNRYKTSARGEAAASTYLGMTILAQKDILDWKDA